MVVDALCVYKGNVVLGYPLLIRPIGPACNRSSWPHLSHEMPFDPAPPPVPKFLYRNGLQKEPPSTDRRAARSQKSDPAPDGGPVSCCRVRAWPCFPWPCCPPHSSRLSSCHRFGRFSPQDRPRYRTTDARQPELREAHGRVHEGCEAGARQGAHACTRTHAPTLPAPVRTSARLRGRAPISSFYWRSPLAPFMALVVPAPPPPLPLTPYPSPLTLQGLREPR